MMLKTKDLYQNLILVGAYGILSGVVYLIVSDGLHLMLGWNVLLAFVPFLFIWIFDRLKPEEKTIRIILLMLWLLFYPNAIYVITDVIYLDFRTFMNIGYLSTLYLQDFNAYLGMFHILFGIIIALYFGLTSLNVIYQYLQESPYKKYKDYMVITVSVLAGIGVYIGRFFRYNSWDVIRVWVIIKDFFLTLSWFTLFYIIMLALLQIFLFYLIYKRKSSI